jgi:hypothetical protein
MKNLKLTFALMLLLGVVACKKNVTNPTTSGISRNITTDDAASMVTSSLSPTTNGVASSVADAIVDASVMFNAHVQCGTTRSDTISRQNTRDSSLSYSFHLTYNFMVDCSNNVPDSLSSNLTWSGSFAGPNWSNSNSGSSIFGVGGLLPADTAYVVNGEFKRSGTFSSKTDTSKHGNNSVDIVVSNLLVKKHWRTIEGGTATFTITGDTPKKGSFGFTGTVVFNADGTATVTINGTVYTVNLTTCGWQRRDNDHEGHGD